MPASNVEVSIGGKTLGEFSPEAMLDIVEVRQSLNDHWWCEVQCHQTPDGRFPVEDSLGQDLTITALDEDGVSRVLFDGFVLEAEMQYQIYGTYGVKVLGVTRSYLMDLTPRQMQYRQASLEVVAQKMAGEVGLDAELIYSPIEPALSFVQWGETDFAFLKRLADDHKCWIRPTAKGIQIYDTFQDQGAKVQWREEEGLRSFTIKGRLGQPSMNGAHYDPGTMESQTYKKVQDKGDFFDGSGPMVDAVSKASQSLLPPGYVHQRARAVTQADYEKLLKKESVRAIGGKVFGIGSSRNEELQPGDTVSIEGPIDAKGSYGVVEVTHRWTPTGYTNDFRCTPWQSYTNPEAPKLKAMPGVVQARVVDNNDPAGQGRVQIKFFWQEDDQTLWTRLVTPHAGADRGMYFVPEIGDEVVVAFGEGDPERYVVLGSKWNGVDKPPVEDFWGGEYGNNDCKRIVTKSGHRLQFIDKEGKETIQLATPKHLKIVMMENSNENGRATMLLQCDGDIVLNAGGRIHMKSAFYSREVG